MLMSHRDFVFRALSFLLNRMASSEPYQRAACVCPSAVSNSNVGIINTNYSIYLEVPTINDTGKTLLRILS
jgi:hypothetical protein